MAFSSSTPSQLNSNANTLPFATTSNGAFTINGNVPTFLHVNNPNNINVGHNNNNPPMIIQNINNIAMTNINQNINQNINKINVINVNNGNINKIFPLHFSWVFRYIFVVWVYFLSDNL